MKKLLNGTLTVMVLMLSASTHAKDCGSSAAFVETLWQKYMEMAVSLGCASAPNANRANTVAACSADPLIEARINAALSRKFNHAKYFQNVVNHPNRLTLATRDGALTGELGKTWIYPELWGESRVNFELQKLAGNNRLRVQVCSHAPGGSPQVIYEDILRGRDPAGTRKDRAFSSNVQNHFISVTVDGREPTLDTTKYALGLKRPNQGDVPAPTRTGPRNVSGFADLHTHIMAHFGFGGGFVHPSPFESPMSSCDGHTHGIVNGAFRQSFDGPHTERTRARTDWPHHLDTAHQQTGAAHLRTAHNNGLSLIVLTAVSNEWASKLLIANRSKDANVPRNDMDSVRLQLRAAIAFAEQNDWVQIARDPWEARRIIARGDLAVVLGVEVSDLFQGNQGAWEDQLDELHDLGVRQLGVVHETDTIFSGAARHHGLTLRLANYLKLRTNISLTDPLNFNNFIDQHAAATSFMFDSPNVVGMKPEGRKLFRRMAAKRMLIDIDHMSRVGRRQAIRFAERQLENYPLLFTHTRYDELMPTRQEVRGLPGYATSEKAARQHHGWGMKGTGEYMATQSEILGIMRLGGMVGLRTGPNHQKTYEPSGVANDCPTSSKSFAQLVAYGNQRYGVAQAFGSDIGSPFVPQLGARFGGGSNGTLACSGYTAPADATPNRGPRSVPMNRIRRQFDRTGLKHIGLMPALLADLQDDPVNAEPMSRSTELLLRTWERAWSDNREKLTFDEYWAAMNIPTPNDFAGTFVAAPVDGQLREATPAPAQTGQPARATRQGGLRRAQRGVGDRRGD